ncbi:transposase domain containing protein [Trichonephila clavipes]|nr:transposase domain containing protein [Trichonephila clavipes]
MSLPPNSSDINPIEYILDVMGRQLQVERPPIRNISDLCDRCLNIWHNLSPAIYQRLVASMPRRVEAGLYAKGANPVSPEHVRTAHGVKWLIATMWWLARSPSRKKADSVSCKIRYTAFPPCLLDIIQIVRAAIHHSRQVKNLHRFPIRKTSPRKSLPRRLFSDGKVLRLPVLSFQRSVKSLAGIAVSFYDRHQDQIYSDAP